MLQYTALKNNSYVGFYLSTKNNDIWCNMALHFLQLTSLQIKCIDPIRQYNKRVL